MLDLFISQPSSRLRTTASLTALLIFIGALLAVGCESPASNTEPVSPQSETDTENAATYDVPHAIPGKVQAKASNTEVLQMLRTSNEAVESFNVAWRSASTLAEKDRLAQKTLQEHADPKWFFLQQEVAMRALSAHLSASASPSASSVALYTRTLVRNESINTPLIRDALRELDGTWSQKTIQSTAQATIDNANEWMRDVESVFESRGTRSFDPTGKSEHAALAQSRHQEIRSNVKTSMRDLVDLMSTR